MNNSPAILGALHALRNKARAGASDASLVTSINEVIGLVIAQEAINFAEAAKVTDDDITDMLAKELSPVDDARAAQGRALKAAFFEIARDHAASVLAAQPYGVK